MMNAIRKVLRTQGRNLTVEIPEEFVSRTLEVIVLPVEEEMLKGKRPYGLAKGQVIVPDAFFDELPEDVLKGFGAT